MKPEAAMLCSLHCSSYAKRAQLPGKMLLPFGRPPLPGGGLLVLSYLRQTNYGFPDQYIGNSLLRRGLMFVGQFSAAFAGGPASLPPVLKAAACRPVPAVGIPAG